MKMEQFWDEFKNYCLDHYITSERAIYYVRAVYSLCQFLEIAEMDEVAVSKIDSIKDSLKDRRYSFYKKLLEYLKGQDRGYLLTDRYMKYAILQFLAFLRDEKNLIPVKQV